MIRAMARGPDGRQILVIGLSFDNLDKLRKHPRDSFIRINGKNTGGLSIDVMIFSTETEAHGAEMMAEFLGPDSEVYVSDKLKS